MFLFWHLAASESLELPFESDVSAVWGNWTVVVHVFAG